MKAFNYRHLHLFWTVATRGSLSAACDALGVTPQTLSEQLRQFETAIGSVLFRREGRGLELTDTGRLVLGYADEMFAIGQQLQEVLAEDVPDAPLRFRAGVADAVPKTVACRLLTPAIGFDRPVRVICREDALDDLLGDLAAHRLDWVLADRPMPPTSAVQAYSHLLGECEIAFFAARSLRQRHGEPFPECLDGAPLLLPGESAVIRPRLMRWFEEQGLRPRLVGEFDDGALMKAFGQAGAGFFPAPSAIAADIERQYGVARVGSIPTLREQFYGISMQRRIEHPVVAAITRTARLEVFTADTG